jgi:hypothetical protein
VESDRSAEEPLGALEAEHAEVLAYHRLPEDAREHAKIMLIQATVDAEDVYPHLLF